MSKITNLLFIIVVITILFMSYLMLIPPTWIIDKQLGALKTGDVEKAYSYTSKEFQKAVTIYAFKNFVQNSENLSHSQGITIYEEKISKNNILFVEGALKIQGAKQVPIKYTLIRGNDINSIMEGWKIQSVMILEQDAWKSLPHNEDANILVSP